MGVRVLSLNVWYGNLLPDLEAFVSKEAPTTDVFCFQEMLDGDPANPNMKDVTVALNEGRCAFDLYERMKRLLPSFRSAITEEYNAEGAKLAIFHRKDLPVRGHDSADLVGSIPATHRDGKYLCSHGSKLQWLVLDGGVVAHTHGLFVTGTYGDTPERIAQSDWIIRMLDEYPGWKVFMGDLNLDPNSESARMLRKGMTDLVETSGIASTRNRNAKGDACPRTDYAFATQNMKTVSFQMLPDVVSDHQALAVDIS